MSRIFRAMMNALAHESQLLDNAVRDVSALTLPANLFDPSRSEAEQGLPVEGTPTTLNIVEVENLVLDPVGHGPAFSDLWTITGAASSPLTPTDLPRHRYAVQLVADGGDVDVSIDVALPEDGIYYWYVLVRSDHLDAGNYARLRQNFGSHAASTFAMVGSLASWTLAYGLLGTVAGAHQLQLHIESAPADSISAITAATVCADDPGEAFHGDMATTRTGAYSWQGARGNSVSRRHGQLFDFLALHEQEHEIGVHPEGLGTYQRQVYLQQRLQARHKPWGETFVALILDVLRSDPGVPDDFSATNVRVLEDHPNYAFTVQINYNPTGALVERIKRLVADIKPAHLICDPDTDIIWGTFRADISAAGDPL